ncbi:MAG: T9SS type A sorting domain-containing protein [Bacteroidia bacterium]
MFQRKFIAIFILGFGLSPKAQNLVNNGDFELYSNCPTNGGQINYATGWINATPSTSPDYFNLCGVFNCSVPYNDDGYQKDYLGGNGYAGIYAFNFYFPNDGREYIQTQLNSTLQAGHKYLGSMYVNTCDAYNYSIGTLGIYLTATAVQGPSTVGFMNVPNPQIKNPILLSDTVNWMLVQDTIIATGTEQYLTIGNFCYDSLSDTVRVYHMGFGHNNDYAYYYIDGVSIYDVTSGACNNYWDAGFDKYIFKGDSIRLGAINTDNSTFNWVNSLGGNTFLSSNTNARPWASPTVTTTYCVNKKCPNNNIFIDTVTVVVTDTNSVGINQISRDKSTIIIYPNPTSDKIYTSIKNGEISLFDVLGNEVLTTKEKEMDVSEFEAGAYFVKVRTKNGISTQKVIIQH